MHEDNNIVKLDKSDFTVVIEDRKVLTPEFTKHAVSRYRLLDGNLLQKQCAHCEKWYDIAKYENGDWVEIWKEGEYRKTKSNTFHSYCTACNLMKSQTSAKREPQSAPFVRQQMPYKGTQKRDNVVWDDDVYKYIMVRCLLEKSTKNTLLNQLLRSIMTKSPITIDYYYERDT